MSAREEIEKIAVHDCYQRTVEWLEINARLGYAVDPSWPAPEVLERPGWKYQRVEDDRHFVEVSVLQAEAEAFSVSSSRERAEPVSFRTERVKPVFWMDFVFVFDPESVHSYGVGIHTGIRVLFLFHRTQPREAARHS